MKNKILFVNLLLILWLSSCIVDEKIENNDKSTTDYDDINIINKIWEQSIDKALKLVNTRTKAS